MGRGQEQEFLLVAVHVVEQRDAGVVEPRRETEQELLLAQDAHAGRARMFRVAGLEPVAQADIGRELLGRVDQR